MGRIASARLLFSATQLAIAWAPAHLALAAPAPAPTVQPGSDIIVTARKRSESAQRVPLSLSVVDGKTIEAADIRNGTNLTARAPNFLAPANAVAISAPTYFIRGVGEGGRNWNEENGVAIFVDDVYLQSTAGAWVDLTDMDRVEVLRGPQGTLYGRNSTSGAIKFVPRLPDPSQVTAYAETALGTGGRIDVKAGANLPIAGGRGAVRFNVYDIRDDGNLTEVNAANEAITDRLARIHHTGARLATLWRSGHGLEFEFNGDIFHQDDGMYVVTPIVPADPLASIAEVFSRRGTVSFAPLYGPGRVALEPLTVGGGAGVTGGGLVFKARFETSLGRLSSISAWRDYHEHFVSQLGGRSTPSTYFGVTLYGNVNTVYEKVSQLTQELQLTGEWGSLVNYAAGIYFFHNRWRESEYGATNGIPANFSPFVIPGQSQPFGGSYNDVDQTTNSYAVYASADWHITPSVTLSAGGRQTWDHKGLFFETLFEDHLHDYPGFPLTTAKRWGRFTPRLGVDWKASSRTMLYASWAKGYKVGGVEGARSPDAATAQHWLNPEIATTWEAGIKASNFRGRLQTNFDVFTSLNVDRTDLISPSIAANSTVRSKGIEGEGSFQVTPDFRLHGALGLIWAKYLKLSPNHPVLQPDPSGFVLGYAAVPPMTPRYTASLDAHYRGALGPHGIITGDASLIAVGRHFHPLGINNFDSDIVAPYAVVDASVGWASANNRLKVTLGAHNLFDKLYWVSGLNVLPEFAGRYYADRRRFYVELRYAQ